MEDAGRNCTHATHVQEPQTIRRRLHDNRNPSHLTTRTISTTQHSTWRSRGPARRSSAEQIATYNFTINLNPHENTDTKPPRFQ